MRRLDGHVDRKTDRKTEGCETTLSHLVYMYIYTCVCVYIYISYIHMCVCVYIYITLDTYTYIIYIHMIYIYNIYIYIYIYCMIYNIIVYITYDIRRDRKADDKHKDWRPRETLPHTGTQQMRRHCFS